MNNHNRLASVSAYGVLILALLLLVGYSVVYRVDHPSLTVHRHDAQSVDQEDMMAMVGQLMQRLEHDSEDITALHGLGQAFMRMEAWSEAQRFWMRLLTLEPDNTAARQHLAICLFRLQEYRAAAEELQHVLTIEPDNGNALFNLGILYAHYLQDADQGREYFERIIELPDAGTELKEQAREQLEDL
jgi:cytochrome c-type biogenesis protein CcmH/NrfG